MSQLNISEAIQTGDFQSASHLLGARLTENPDDWKSWSLLGMCFRELDDLNQAQTCLRKAVELQPNSRSTLLALADSEYRLTQFVGCFETLDLILELNPLDADALVLKTQILIDLGRFDAAIGVLSPVDEDDHRKNLVRKDPHFYSFFRTAPLKGYLWPVNSSKRFRFVP